MAGFFIRRDFKNSKKINDLCIAFEGQIVRSFYLDA
jgi:hypothetical protein